MLNSLIDSSINSDTFPRSINKTDPIVILGEKHIGANRPCHLSFWTRMIELFNKKKIQQFYWHKILLVISGNQISYCSNYNPSLALVKWNASLVSSFYTKKKQQHDERFIDQGCYMKEKDDVIKNFQCRY
jgi:hypothetical protein